MQLQDAKTVLQQAVAQAMGHEYMEQNGYLTEIPAEKLVDVGKDLADSENTAEKFTKALVVILAKREVDKGIFKPFYDDIMIDRIDWGGFVERAKIDWADIMDDPALNLEDGKSYADIEHTFYQPKVSSKLYSEGKGIMIPISIQRRLLFESFRGYDEINSYITKIQAKVRDTLLKAYDRYASILVNAGIAISAKATRTAVYLLDEAVADGVEGITAQTTPAQAMQNNAFILYVAEKIAEVRDNMEYDSTVYNNGNWSTGSTDNKLYLLSAYARRLKFGVKSGLFNKEDVGFGAFKTIPAWQAARKTENGKGFQFETASAINFAADKENKLGIGTDAFDVNGVVGFLFDRKAIGMTIFQEYTTSNYTASADFWNEYVHSLTNQIVDSDYPMVAFIVGRDPNPVAATLKASAKTAVTK